MSSAARPRDELESLNEAVLRLTRLGKELYVGWSVFVVIALVGGLWALTAFGINAAWGRHAGLWLGVLLAVSLAAALRARVGRDWPNALGVARRIDAERHLDNVVVSAWILRERPELCGSEVIRKALSRQALPEAHDYQRAFRGRERRQVLAAALAVLLVVLLLLWLFLPAVEPPAPDPADPGTEEASESPAGPGPLDSTAPAENPDAPSPEEEGTVEKPSTDADSSSEPGALDDSTDASGDGTGGGGSAAAEAREDLRDAEKQLRQIAEKHPGIEQGKEIQGPRDALEQALQDPSPERLKEAADALEQASGTAAQMQSATSTRYGKKARDVSEQLAEMAEKLRDAAGRMADKGSTGSGQGQDGQAENGTEAGQGEQGGQGQGKQGRAGQGGQGEQGQGGQGEQGQGGQGGQGQGEQGAANGAGAKGAGVGGRDAGTGSGGDHRGGAPAANEAPKDSDEELTRRMAGEEGVPDQGPEPGSGDPGRSEEQILSNPTDPDIVLDEDFERRLDALRASGGTPKENVGSTSRKEGGTNL